MAKEDVGIIGTGLLFGSDLKLEGLARPGLFTHILCWQGGPPDKPSVIYVKMENTSKAPKTLVRKRKTRKRTTAHL